MPFSSDQKKRILAALNERAPGRTKCPVCTGQTWTLVDGVVSLPIQEDPKVWQVPGPNLPNIALVCQKCGNTQILNVLVLGLSEELGLTPAKTEQASAQSTST